jgi:hypothetical protein
MAILYMVIQISPEWVVWLKFGLTGAGGRCYSRCLTRSKVKRGAVRECWPADSRGGTNVDDKKGCGCEKKEEKKEEKKGCGCGKK